MGTGRLEAFSDGVIAVAITLLVLTINVPEPRHSSSLLRELGANWPEYAAYVTSFMTIGIIWINHHAALSRLRQVDHTTLMLNLVLLMTIVILPFATELVAKYLRVPHGQRLAAGIYGGAFLVMAVAFSAFNRHILIRRPDLLLAPLGETERRRLFNRALSGLIPYVIATALAAVSAYLTIAICGALAAFYAHPAASGNTFRVARSD